MHRQRNMRIIASQVCLAICSGITVSIGDAAELTPFRLTGIEGYVELRFREDEQDISSGGGSSSREVRTSIEEEVFLLTHSYFYHPNFLQMDFGIGPVFVQNKLESSAGSAEDDDALYNLTAKLRFLETKPYPFTLFYDRQNPSVSLSLTDRFQQESTKQRR